jgi:hypothetical protein
MYILFIYKNLYKLFGAIFMFLRIKIFIISAIFAALIFGLSINPAYAQYDGCLPCSQPNTAQYVQLWNVVLPQFPDCPIDIHYWILTCPGSDVKYISDLSWGLSYTPGSNCDALIGSFVKKNPDGSIWIDWEEFQKIYMYAYDKIGMDLFTSKDPSLYQCGQNNYVEIKYTQSYCSAFRLVLKIVMTTNGPSIGINCIQRKACDIGGCCTYSNIYCWENGDPKVTHSDSHSGTCPPQPPPIFTCVPQSGEFSFTTPCQTWCAPRP